jgi:hypothetical protein
MNNKIELILSNDEDEIRRLVKNNFCPVECSINNKSIVDKLKMDHHNNLSHLEPVSLRAYRDFFGVRSKNPRFVVAGTADADACFAIASLAGIIPHPKRKKEGKEYSKNYLKLAQTIAKKDLGKTRETINLPFGKYLVIWRNLIYGNAKNQLGLYLGVGLWSALLSGDREEEMLEIISSAENVDRINIGRKLEDLNKRSVRIGSILVIKNSQTWGFKLWFKRIKNKSINSPNGRENPIIMAWSGKYKNVRINLPNKLIAEKIFGKGGLKNVLKNIPKLVAIKEEFGVSERGIKLTWLQVKKIAKQIDEYIKKRQKD